MALKLAHRSMSRALMDGAFACSICRSAHVSSGNMAVWGWIQCRNGILIDDQLMCEKLTLFLYADYMVEFCEWLAFLWYSQVQDRSGGWHEMYTNVTVQKHPIWRLQQPCCCRLSSVAIRSGPDGTHTARIRQALYALSTYMPLHAIAYWQ